MKNKIAEKQTYNVLITCFHELFTNFSYKIFFVVLKGLQSGFFGKLVNCIGIFVSFNLNQKLVFFKKMEKKIGEKIDTYI